MHEILLFWMVAGFRGGWSWGFRWFLVFQCILERFWALDCVAGISCVIGFVLGATWGFRVCPAFRVLSGPVLRGLSFGLVL